MRTAIMTRKTYPAIPYPNAASRRQIAHKFLDFLLVTVSCAGIAAMVLLLAVLA